MRTNVLISAGVLGLALVAAPAAAQCNGAPCAIRVAVRGTAVMPPPEQFRLRGERFTEEFTDVPLATNGFRSYELGFTMNLGFGLVSSINVHENGFVTFNAPSAVAAVARSTVQSVISPTLPFVPVRDLRELGVPVIAPFYADLVQGDTSGDTRLNPGDVVVQYGFADPYADGGAYSEADLRKAVRVTWYGLGVAGAGSAQSRSPNGQVYAQLLLSSDLNGASSFQFNYGPLESPGQQGYGSIAGFALGTNYLQFGGPYVDGIPTFFEFQGGRFVGLDGAVPEPSTWAQLLLGFGLLGGALRRGRRRRSAVPA